MNLFADVRSFLNPCYPRLHIRLGLEQLNCIELTFQLLLGIEPVDLAVTWAAEERLLISLLRRHFPFDLFVVTSPWNEVVLGQTHIPSVA